MIDRNLGNSVLLVFVLSESILPMSSSAPLLRIACHPCACDSVTERCLRELPRCGPCGSFCTAGAPQVLPFLGVSFPLTRVSPRAFTLLTQCQQCRSALAAVFGNLRIKGSQRKSDNQDSFLISSFNFSAFGAAVFRSSVCRYCNIFKFMILFSGYWKSDSLLVWSSF